MSELTRPWPEMRDQLSSADLERMIARSERMLPVPSSGTEPRQAARDGKALLLHLCCGPCGEYPLQVLREQGWAVTGCFYNPNIHPEAERLKRAWNVLRLAELKAFTVYYDAENREEEWRAFGGGQAEHCRSCYSLRMDRAAAEAAAGGFRTFTTSLLVSPYQDRGELVAAGQRAARRHGVTFLDLDFRGGYREGQDMARADGLYRQKYCGCIYSLGETGPRFLKRYLEEFGLDDGAVPVRERKTADDER